MADSLSMNYPEGKDCTDNLQQRWEEVRELGMDICSAMSKEVEKLGLPSEKVSLTAPWERACFELQTDPASGQASLVGTWKNANSQRVGTIIFHCDGSFFAEYDVVEAHPTKKSWFIEAVSAWGRDQLIKSEARLIPMPQ